MGLDIYLYKAKTVPSDDDLGEEGDSFKEECVDLPSKIYPEHFFRVGYFRSSYNEGGINQVLGASINMDLYDIFNSGDKYILSPDWKLSLIKVEGAIKKYKEFLNSPVGKYGITTIHDFGKGSAKNKDEAFDVFKKQFENHAKDARAFDSYSCGDGNFYLGEPLKVAGIIKGSGTGFNAGEHYVVYEKTFVKPEDEFYLQALEIVKETIEYVLAQKDGMKYYFHWSG